MFYLDTSFIAPAFLSEAQSESTLAWLAARSAGSLYFSPWVVTEFASALARKRRLREIRPSQMTKILPWFETWMTEHCSLVPIEIADFDRAKAMIAHPDSMLRAGDALHLAVVERRQLALKTYDIALARASQQFAITIAD